MRLKGAEIGFDFGYVILIVISTNVGAKVEN
jgi:hypothetical protein